MNNLMKYAKKYYTVGDEVGIKLVGDNYGNSNWIRGILKEIGEAVIVLTGNAKERIFLINANEIAEMSGTIHEVIEEIEVTNRETSVLGSSSS